MHNPLIIPGAPAELQAKIDTHRVRYAGVQMMADEPKGNTDDDSKDADKDGFKSEESKRAVLADLAKERGERQKLQQEIEALKPIKDQFDTLRSAFGPQGEDKPDLAAQFAAMQKRLDDAEAKEARDALVAEVADAHEGLTASDVKLLRAMPDKETMEALATRLSQGAKPGTPKPDPSAGRGSGSESKNSSVMSGRDLFAERHKKST